MAEPTLSPEIFAAYIEPSTKQPLLIVTAAGVKTKDVSFVKKPVSLLDIRQKNQVENFNIENNAFEFLTHQSSIPPNELLRIKSLPAIGKLAMFDDPISRRYADEIIEVLRKRFVGAQVIPYEIRRRSHTPSFTEGHMTHMPGIPQTWIHNNYTEMVGKQILRMAFSEQEIKDKIDSGKWRAQLFNVWRPIKKVECWPLMFCDARTVTPKDIITLKVKPSEDEEAPTIRELSGFLEDEKHRFYWLSNQLPHEISLSTLYDSLSAHQVDWVSVAPQATFMRFEDLNVPSRESINMRCIVITSMGE